MKVIDPSWPHIVGRIAYIMPVNVKLFNSAGYTDQATVIHGVMFKNVQRRFRKCSGMNEMKYRTLWVIMMGCP